MLTVHLIGGLGNQLFQIAAAEHIAKRTGRQFYISNLNSPDTVHSKQKYFKNIFSRYTSKYNPTRSSCIIEEAKPSFVLEDWSRKIPPSIPAPMLLGYFQRHEYIQPDFIENIVLPEIDYSKYPDISRAVFLHIRGGDYLGHPLHHVQLEDYYRKAVALFPEDTLFYIFTNDQEYTTTLLWLPKLCIFVKEEDELMSLSLMSRCAGGICPNSTFSWWGAYINQWRRRDRGEGHSHGQLPLVIPDKWFNDETFIVDGYFFDGATVLTV